MGPSNSTVNGFVRPCPVVTASRTRASTGCGLLRDGDGVALGGRQARHHDDRDHGCGHEPGAESGHPAATEEHGVGQDEDRQREQGRSRASAIRGPPFGPPGVSALMRRPAPGDESRLRASLGWPGAYHRRNLGGNLAGLRHAARRRRSGRSPGRPPIARGRSWPPAGRRPGTARTPPPRARGSRATVSAPSTVALADTGGVDELVHRSPGRRRHAWRPPARRPTACPGAHRREQAGGRRGRGDPGPRGAPGPRRRSGPPDRPRAGRRGSRRPPGRRGAPGRGTGPVPCSSAHAAVVRAPLRAPASTTTVASASPLMIRLRRGKVPRDRLRVRRELAQDRASARRRSTARGHDVPRDTGARGPRR